MPASRPSIGEQERWDEKHAAEQGRPPGAPDPFLLRALERVRLESPARALDLAAGGGRNGLELLRRGLEVEAWDVSPVGLRLFEQRAHHAGFTLKTRTVDLGAELPATGRKCDLVVVVNFLDRALLMRLGELVRPGGFAVCATFTEDRAGDRPALRHCLERGELGRGQPGFETRLVQEEGGRAGWLGQKTGGYSASELRDRVQVAKDSESANGA